MQFWNSTTEAAVTIFSGIVAVALLAVLVSKKSNTASVIQNLGSAFSNGLAVAVSPVTGNDATPNLSYAGAGFSLGSFGSNLPTFN